MSPTLSSDTPPLCRTTRRCSPSSRASRPGSVTVPREHASRPSDRSIASFNSRPTSSRPRSRRATSGCAASSPGTEQGARPLVQLRRVLAELLVWIGPLTKARHLAAFDREHVHELVARGGVAVLPQPSRGAADRNHVVAAVDQGL